MLLGTRCLGVLSGRSRKIGLIKVYRVYRVYACTLDVDNSYFIECKYQPYKPYKPFTRFPAQ